MPILLLGAFDPPGVTSPCVNSGRKPCEGGFRDGLGLRKPRAFLPEGPLPKSSFLLNKEIIK